MARRFVTVAVTSLAVSTAGIVSPAVADPAGNAPAPITSSQPSESAPDAAACGFRQFAVRPDHELVFRGSDADQGAWFERMGVGWGVMPKELVLAGGGLWGYDVRRNFLRLGWNGALYQSWVTTKNFGQPNEVTTLDNTTRVATGMSAARLLAFAPNQGEDRVMSGRLYSLNSRGELHRWQMDMFTGKVRVMYDRPVRGGGSFADVRTLTFSRGTQDVDVLLATRTDGSLVEYKIGRPRARLMATRVLKASGFGAYTSTTVGYCNVADRIIVGTTKDGVVYSTYDADSDDGSGADFGRRTVLTRTFTSRGFDD